MLVLITGSKLFDTLMVFLKKNIKKVDFEKISRQQKSGQNFPGSQNLSENDYHTFSKEKNVVMKCLLMFQVDTQRDEARMLGKFLMEF